MFRQRGLPAPAGICRGATPAGAASTHRLLGSSRFRRNHSFGDRVDVTPRREETTMRWNTSHHDPRLVDLLAIVVIAVAIASAWFYFADRPDAISTAAFIVPSQSVRW